MNSDNRTPSESNVFFLCSVFLYRVDIGHPWLKKGGSDLSFVGGFNARFRQSYNVCVTILQTSVTSSLSRNSRLFSRSMRSMPGLPQYGMPSRELYSNRSVAIRTTIFGLRCYASEFFVCPAPDSVFLRSSPGRSRSMCVSFLSPRTVFSWSDLARYRYGVSICRSAAPDPGLK